jgi:putative membrane protein
VVWFFGWDGLVFAPPAAALGVLRGFKQAAGLGHAIAGDFFFFRSGWIWRHVTVAPLDKVQAVQIVETPFDRRHGMASLVVDTAGAAGAPHRLDVPFLDRDLAASVAHAIAGRAAGSALSW